jgi:hypothetical protein
MMPTHPATSIAIPRSREDIRPNIVVVVDRGAEPPKSARPAS